MKKLFLTLFVLIIPFISAGQQFTFIQDFILSPAYAGRLVYLPLTEDLEGTTENLTDGSLSRVSAATYIDTSGVLQTAYGNRENLILYSEDTSNWTGSGPWTQTVAVAANTSYVISTGVDGATVSTADDTATTDGPASATYGNEDTFTCSVAGNITVTTDTADPKAQLEALPSGNTIGPNLFDQDGGADSDEDKGAFTVKEYDTELVLNGDFEDWTAGDADNWTEFEGGDCSVTEETSIVNGGSSSTKMVIGAACHGNTEQTFSVDANTKYRICFSEYSSGTLKTLIRDSANDELNWSTTLWGGYVENSHVGTTSWNEHCIETTTNNGVNDISIKFFNTNSNETYYIDDVSVKKVLSAGLLNAELVTNGTMESDSDWWNWSTPTTRERSSEQAHAGTYSQKFTVDAQLEGLKSNTGITTTTGKLYKFNAWVYPDDATNVHLVILQGSDGSTQVYNSNKTGLTQDSWNEIEVYYIEAGGGNSAGMRFLSTTGQSSGTWYIDDVSIKEVDISWTRYGTNTMEIDEAVGDGGAFKITGDGSNQQGARLVLGDATDLNANLTQGETFLISFDAKVGSSDTIAMAIHDGTSALASTGNIAESFTTYELIFTKGAAALDFRTTFTVGSGEEIWIDNITIKSIPDLALLEPSTYTATSGSTESIPAQARFETEGLLLEGEATNLLEYSEDFSEWINYAVFTSQSGLSDPAGGNNAHSIEQTWQNQSIDYSTVSPTASATYTLSVWAKADQNQSALIKLQDEDNTESTDQTISVTTEWQRFEVSHTFSASYADMRVVIWPSTWNGPLQKIYLYGAQLEQSPYVTSYIPTDGAQATRTSEAGDGYGVSFTMSADLTDIFTDTGGDDTDTQSIGTLVTTWTPQYDETDMAAGTYGIVTSHGTIAATVLYHNAGTILSNDGTATTTVTNPTWSAGDEIILAARWDDQTNKMIVSEKSGGSWTHDGTPAAYDGTYPRSGELWLHYNNQYPAHYKNLMVFDDYLPDAAIESGAYLQRGASGF